jgi:hypothetical protein
MANKRQPWRCPCCGLEIPKHSPSATGVRVEFIGYQDMGIGYAPEPLFNIYGDHRLNRSTVGIETLNREGIEVPPYPFPSSKIKNSKGDRHS